MRSLLEPPLDETSSTSHSRTRLVVHLSWSVKQRRPMLDPSLDVLLDDFFRRKAAEVDTQVLAYGAGPDHVHLLIRLPATRPLSLVLNQLKGASSRMLNQDLFAGSFDWQDGYWASSCDPDDLVELLAYVARQRQHHAAR